ncbi:MAG TPA: transcriptional regulator [Candidatus Binatia bacterium]|nr:transcriptional regulator [Candidatus Binatia bacterium]
MHKRAPAEPRGRDATVREELHAVLLAGPATARDLSKRVGIPEHEVAGHLEHLERSLKHRDEKLVIEPPRCMDCGFAFTRRHRFTRPSGCPQCRGRRITLPQFHIEA